MSPALDPQPGKEELAHLAQHLDASERVLLAQQYLAAGYCQEALELCRPPAGVTSEWRGLALCEARARFGLGDGAGALALVSELCAARPGDVLAVFYHAQLLARAGHVGAAIERLREVVGLFPDYPGALVALAQLALPGPHYVEVLRHLHVELAPRTYLEIGVEHGKTLQLARNSSRVIGIDPVPRPSPHELPPGAQLFHMTSDAFFETHARSELLGDVCVDLAFIDGMHWFDVALRDFRNVERWCAPGSVVVMHDCLPIARAAAHRHRQTRFWVGDTWKALEYLLQHRPDLKIRVVPCYPSGLIVITNLNPTAADPSAEEQRFVSEHLEQPYPYPAGTWPPHYPMIENSESGLVALLVELGLRTGCASPVHPGVER